MSNSCTRRKFLRFAALGASGVLLASCQPKIVKEVVKETVEVEKEKVVEKTVVVEKKVEKEITKVVEKAVTKAPVKGEMRLATINDASVNAVMDILLAGFGTRYPEVKVKIEYQVGDYSERMYTQAAAGNLADAVWTANLFTLGFVANGVLKDLMPFIEKDKEFNLDDIYPVILSEARIEGNPGLFYLPASLDVVTMFYNKTALEQAGAALPTADWTWADFRDAAKALTSSADKQFGWAYVNDGSEDTVWRFLAVLWQAGGDLLNADNTASALDSDAGRRAMQMLYDMAVTDKSVYLDKGDGNYLNLFNAGKIAMLWTGPWDISSINSDVDYGVEILPADVTHATIAGPDNYVVLDNGDQQVANAWAFIQWFCSPEVHLDYAIATGHLPIRKSETQLPAYQDYLAKYPAAEVFVANLDNVTKARPNIPTYPKISIALGQAVQSVLLGRAQPDQAITVASQAIDAILATGQ